MASSVYFKEGDSLFITSNEITGDSMAPFDNGSHAGIQKPRRKLYYSLKQVSEMLEINPPVIKGWEKHFPEIKPVRNRAGNRYYTDKDIHLLLYIKELLMDKKLDVSTAKTAFTDYLQELDAKEHIKLRQVLGEIKMEIGEILQLFET